MEGDRISLELPTNTEWIITPDRDPCQVCVCLFCWVCCYIMCVFYYPQLTKDMLDSHEREPYPPMIVLKIEQNRLQFQLYSSEDFGHH